jgi:tetratricopeptide (TPR) repeat protein
MPLTLLKRAVFAYFGISLSQVLFAAVAASPEMKWRKELSLLRSDPVTAARRVEEARLLYRLGTNEKTESSRLRLFEEGRDLAESVRKVEPRNPGAILWWVANEGAIAENKKNLASLATVRHIERALKKLRSIDPDFGYAVADRALGNVYRRAPSFISIGSSRKAEQCLRKAFERAPGFPGNSLALAVFLWEEGRKDEARGLALRVASSKEYQKGNFGDFSAEREEWKLQLQQILGTK